MATRKRKPAKRKTTRRTKSKRRRGLGDLLSDRATSIALKVARAGKKPNAAKIEAAAAASLCREGHKSYCGGAATRRAGRAAAKAVKAAHRCSQLNAERVAAGLKPKPCDQSVSAATTGGSSTCKDTKRSTCLPKSTPGVYVHGKRGKERLRKGCHAVKGSSEVRCSNRVVSAISRTMTPKRPVVHAGKGFRVVTAKVAKKKDGTLKQGCRKRKGHFECHKSRVAFYTRAKARKKKKH